MWLAGVSSLAEAEKRAGKELWEWWLDALSFRSDSAGRLHIRQMLKHPSMQSKMRSLFDGLDVRRAGALDAAAVVRFSDGIQGTVRVLLDRDNRGGHAPHPHSHSRQSATIDIPASTPAEHDFMARHGVHSFTHARVVCV